MPERGVCKGQKCVRVYVRARVRKGVGERVWVNERVRESDNVGERV